MSETVVPIFIDGRQVGAKRGTSVAVAIMNEGLAIRRSVAGEPRAALCGMGVCHECRVTIDGRAHQRSCMVSVAPGMKIERNA